MSKKIINEKLEKKVPISDKERAKLSAPRNEILKKLSEQGGNSGAGYHKDKRLEEKYGKDKHKKKNFGY